MFSHSSRSVLDHLTHLAQKKERKKKPPWRRSEVLVTQLCPTFCDPMDCSPPGSSVRGILQARLLERVAIPFSRWRREKGGGSSASFRYPFIFLWFKYHWWMPKVRLKEKQQESGSTGHLLTGVSYRRLCEIFFFSPTFKGVSSSTHSYLGPQGKWKPLNIVWKLLAMIFLEGV